MASKLAKVAMMGTQPHTAGLFSDSSVDGPEIGTLVLIVDRARNLPNRKTMGKQDAYCAARLGKEAKKTETDRRGGQTPKWDQELRFVVHDALDYHQLKVSVFSEDKRTDLIGECWIPLDTILTPGGGKKDLWQALNFKGKFAGEIRVELTFYDSRPREIKQEEITALREKDAMKPVKRRPLPADPTNGNAAPVSWHGPRPLPSVTPNNRAQEIQPRQEEFYQDSSIAQSRSNDYQYERPRSELGFGSHSDLGIGSRDRAYSNLQPSVADEYEEPDFNYNGSAVSAPATYGGIELPELPPHTPRSHRSSNAVTPKYYTPVNTSPAFTLPQYDRTPEAQSPLGRERSGSGNPFKNDTYQGSPLRAHSVDDSIHNQQYQDHSPRHHSAGEHVIHNDQFSSPPPPPRHSRGPSTPQGQTNFSQYPSNYSPAPLNIRRPGSSTTASPLVHEFNPQHNPHRDLPEDGRMSSALALSAPPTATHTPATKRYNHYGDRRGSVEPQAFDNQPIQSTPPNRRPQSYAPQSHGSPYGHEQIRQDPYRQNHQISRSFDDVHGHDMHQNHANNPQQYAHREGAPIAKPRAISPGARATTRKSVSPRPSMAPEEPSLRGVAFSPDSFDQFNPNMGSSNPASQVATPESVRGGPRNHETPTKVEASAPIIGSDGRVIDPSDHLPSDTWAPEPEKKSPRKSHQINVKFRHIPQNTQQRTQATPPRALPQVGSRPVSMAPTPTQQMPQQHQNYAADDTMSQVSSSSGGRNRLHKRQPGHINSSPNVPLPQQHRTPPASQPLRENPNYGYQNGSPSYGRQSMSGPPPVPAKIPHVVEQEQWQHHHHHHQQQQQHQYQNQQYSGYQQQAPAMSLSEEMSRIDIGAGGSGRARRGPIRYGAY